MPTIDTEGIILDSGLYETIKSIALSPRPEVALPTRDVLLAQDQLANMRRTLESINQDIERMEADSFMGRKQAD